MENLGNKNKNNCYIFLTKKSIFDIYHNYIIYADDLVEVDKILRSNL